MNSLVKTAVTALATYRITKLVLEDEIFAEPRNALLKRFNPQETKIGYLLTCPWCVSVWAGVAVAAGLKYAPKATEPVAQGLAASAVTGLMYERL